ncbi:hypothetical protein [Bradyrhizobium sp. OAE829]|uniref:hypothetical protein n=1 Tax=Bradyrhizobium sp. OAE829 TaxID=2663807 RepID=UPI00178BE388
MPVKRRKSKRNKTIFELTEAQRAFLHDEPLPHGTEGFEAFQLRRDCAMDDEYPSNSALWEAYREEVLAAWIADHPGTRPNLWWRFDAPRSAPEALGLTSEWPDKLEEPRRQLGGSSQPLYQTSAYAPRFWRGIPTDWPWVGADKFNLGTPIDWSDPPKFESEAAYLDRHGLLSPAERRRLTADDFEPVALESGEPLCQ